MSGVLLDECVNRRYAAAIFADIADVAETNQWLARSADDREVMGLARRLDRILVTETSDSARLCFVTACRHRQE